MPTSTVSPLPGIVLCRPQHAGNIGSVCRAMANFGFTRLYLVAPPTNWRKAEDFFRMSNGYVRALADIVVVQELAELFPFFSSMIGFSRRSGSGRPVRGDLQDAVRYADAHHPLSDVALVFGNERTGLSLEEIQRCEALFCIPTMQEHGSLNLSFAAGLAMYMFAEKQQSIAAHTDVPNYEMLQTISLQETTKLSQNLIDTITMRKPLYDRVKQEGYARLHRIIARAGISEVEHQWLQGLIARLRHELQPATMADTRTLTKEKKTKGD